MKNGSSFVGSRPKIRLWLPRGAPRPGPQGGAGGRATIQHAPSYLGRQPALKDLPPPPPALRIPSAHPPAPVERPGSAPQLVTKAVATRIRFSPEFESLIAPATPDLKFNSSNQESPEPARFLIAVNDKGEVRHCFLQTSSGDAALDEQARKYLAASRFPAIRNSPSSERAPLTWGFATVEWGNDIVPPPSASPAPTAP
jgi:hypothetical protein